VAGLADDRDRSLRAEALEDVREDVLATVRSDPLGVRMVLADARGVAVDDRLEGVERQVVDLVEDVVRAERERQALEVRRCLVRVRDGVCRCVPDLDRSDMA
jgi:hypothetical protein